METKADINKAAQHLEQIYGLQPSDMDGIEGMERWLNGYSAGEEEQAIRDWGDKYDLTPIERFKMTADVFTQLGSYFRP